MVRRQGLESRTVGGGIGAGRRRHRPGVVTRNEPDDLSERVTAAEGAAALPHSGQPRRIGQQSRDRLGQHPAVHLLDDLAGARHGLFVHHHRPAAARHRAGVHHLVIAWEVRFRDDDGRQAERREFVEASGPSPRDGQVGERVDVLDLVEERPADVEAGDLVPLLLGIARCQPRAHVARRVVAARSRQPRAVHDERAVAHGEQVAERIHDRAIDGAGALRSAEHEDDLAVRRDREIELGAGVGRVDRGDAAPQRVTGDDGVAGEAAQRFGEGHEDPVGETADQLVQLPWRGVLLVNEDPDVGQVKAAEEGRRKQDGRGRESPGPDQQVGSEGQQNRGGLEHAHGQVREEPQQIERRATARVAGGAHEPDGDGLARDDVGLRTAAHADKQEACAVGSQGLADGQGRVHVPGRPAACQQYPLRPAHAPRLHRSERRW